MVYSELISRKLSRLQAYVDELKAAKAVTWEKHHAEKLASASRPMKNIF